MRRRTTRLPSLLWGLVCAALTAGAMATTPETPRRDHEVVEVLRDHPLSSQEKTWRTLRAQARAQPAHAALAVAVASQAIQWSRLDGDPRLLGQAQAALAHWWTSATPPPGVRLMRATILQSTHDFDAALTDLRALVQLPATAPLSAPHRIQTWLTLASVLLVTGQYDEAQRACDTLVDMGAPWHGRACGLELLSYRGDAESAQRGLAQLATQAPRDIVPLIQLMRAELAERQGDGRQAAALYQALLLRQRDAYTEGAYADLLLDEGRAAEVLTLLKGRERNDALLLRLAEAGAAIQDPANGARVSALRARFDAARDRGDSVHLREEARFTLRLLKQPARALKLAQRNWAVQKEPADARLLLEAARAAGQPQAADDVRAFMQRWGWTDRRLDRLL